MKAKGSISIQVGAPECTISEVEKLSVTFICFNTLWQSLLPQSHLGDWNTYTLSNWFPQQCLTIVKPDVATVINKIRTICVILFSIDL